MPVTSRRDMDGGWAWWVLVASYVNLLLCSGLAYAAGMFQVVFLEEYRGSVALTSWVTALFSSLMQLGGPLSSLVANATNCRVSVMVGGAMLCIGLALSGLADSLRMLFVSFGVIAGIGLGLTYSASIIIVNYYFDKRRTMVTGIALSASGLGLILAPQVSTFLFHHLSWRATLFTLSAAAAQICIMGALMFPIHESWNKHCLSLRNKLLLLCGISSDSKNSKGDDPIAFRSHTDMEIVIESLDDREKEELIDNHSLCTQESDIPQCTHHNSSESKPELKELDGDDISLLPATQPNGYLSSQHHLDMHHSSQPEIKDSHSLVPVAKSKQSSKHESVSKKHPKLSKHENSSTPSLRENLAHRILHHSHKQSLHTQSHYELNKPLHQLLKTKANVSCHELYRDPHLHTKTHPTSHRIRMFLHSHPRHSVQHDEGNSQSYHSLPFSQKSQLLNPQSCQVIVVSHNQSLTSLVPSVHVEIISSPEHDLQQDHSKAMSLASLHSALKITEVDKLATSIKSSVLSVTSLNVQQIKDTNKKQPSLFCNTGFLILCLQLFIANAGCGIINIHMPSFFKAQGLTDQEMTNMLSINGFACMFGRFVVGFLASATGLDLLLYWALHILGGIFAIMMPDVGTGYVSLAVVVASMGMFYGAVYSVLTSITIQYVGLENLATAFGAEMVFAGLGFFVAPPCAGIIVDLTGSYIYDMYCGGSLYILSSLVLMLLPILKPEVSRVVEEEEVEDGYVGNENDGPDNNDDNSDKNEDNERGCVDSVQDR